MDISDVQTTSWCGFHIPLLWPENPKGLIVETEKHQTTCSYFHPFRPSTFPYQTFPPTKELERWFLNFFFGLTSDFLLDGGVVTLPSFNKNPGQITSGFLNLNVWGILGGNSHLAGRTACNDICTSVKS